jgi:hypothetical protein
VAGPPWVGCALPGEAAVGLTGPAVPVDPWIGDTGAIEAVVGVVVAVDGEALTAVEPPVGGGTVDEAGAVPLRVPEAGDAVLGVPGLIPGLGDPLDAPESKPGRPPLLDGCGAVPGDDSPFGDGATDELLPPADAGGGVAMPPTGVVEPGFTGAT